MLAADNCSGCGLCAALDPQVTLELNGDGYLRPLAPENAPAPAGAAETFAAACPGRIVRAPVDPGGKRHPILGPYRAVLSAFATDPEQRTAGSSGGVLTAIAASLLASGAASRVIGAKGSPERPRLTTTVSAERAEDAASMAGSRYAPVGNASVLPNGPQDIFIGKPCEVSAVRSVVGSGPDAPLLMSFFCAGTPSQHATDRLLVDLGMPSMGEPTRLRYRGGGWPGTFRAEAGDWAGETSYEESWGRALGPTVQWRCKVCPDGTGWSADVVAGDFWQADSRGYPQFVESDGVSALIARTDRGQRLVEAALGNGTIHATKAEATEIAAVQPLQVERLTTLYGRRLGAAAAGKSLPRFVGFRLGFHVVRHPIRNLRFSRGTFVRARSA
ncbi:Coenzyme F420 hydrogenase/dehydrogenase, beta subunit C-terminal domain [Nocardioides sp. TRM66260-LWL]|uniref:Coenzyme F420 hydrogenase/dehydrogenase, beta subunit C-terminal domain n=1 Tax=Nocardioides sp. TRM66260-LWL TaxID=2874478 RepID=UPI001CC53938|nr:Coenzyme F420 hydrogenase/dehydrogenase, beta subunit C-terminal domain [Nocardioides sp. TRM66260-LWL]MBZ5734936.1 Coenzyme F420 hydrogenase/dehydrogenase, beta subunit C-terminal domain [Nocardioides sp. TRM66260-LWL]